MFLLDPEGKKALQKANIDEKTLPVFSQQYDHWYTKSHRLIEKVAPHRLNDFVDLYKKPKIKELTFSNYCISDALLGAAALGDIGKHFPDTDPKWKGADSLKLLEQVGVMLEEKCLFIENIDATIIAQAPKMRPHIDTMRANIARALKLDVEQVNVKATTEEGMGFTGEGKGISAQAICLVQSPTNLFNERMDGRKCEGCGGCARQ